MVSKSYSMGPEQRVNPGVQPSMSTDTEPIQHDESGGRGEFFVERVGKRVAELTYSASGSEAVVGHTWVDPALRGGPLAPRLVNAAVEWARREKRRIVPVCSYVRAVFERTPAYGDVWRKR
jgi:predicted GNAT family acetyltransferase